MPKHRNILLVDDNEINNLLHERLIELSDFGAPVVVRQTAPEALEFLLSIADSPDQIPEFIFLDIRMPIMDGFGFMDEFQKMPEALTGKSKVILLSSTLDPEDNEKAKRYPHVVKMLQKPLTVDQLNSI
ncbi:MAG TPA: response regulator [Chitinophagales bacterium]|nr:response regulator [Chitinophagales bacterium]